MGSNFKGMKLQDIPIISGNILICELNKLIERIETLEETAFGIFRYVNNNCLITATALGVVVTRLNGTITVTVPNDVYLLGININSELADLDDSNNLYIRVVNTTETTVNQDIDSSVDLPQVSYINTTTPITFNAGVASEVFQAPYDSTKNISVVEVAGGNITLKIESIVDDYFIVKLSF
jgi:hypothetical protein